MQILQLAPIVDLLSIASGAQGCARYFHRSYIGMPGIREIDTAIVGRSIERGQQLALVSHLAIRQPV